MTLTWQNNPFGEEATTGNGLYFICHETDRCWVAAHRTKQGDWETLGVDDTKVKAEAICERHDAELRAVSMREAPQ